MTRLIIFLAFLLFGSIAANLYQFAEHRQQIATLNEKIKEQKTSITFHQQQAKKAEEIAERRLRQITVIEAKRRHTLNELERLKHENPDVKSWADTSVPDAIKRLLNAGRSNHAEPSADLATPADESEPPDN